MGKSLEDKVALQEDKSHFPSPRVLLYNSDNLISDWMNMLVDWDVIKLLTNCSIPGPVRFISPRSPVPHSVCTRQQQQRRLLTCKDPHTIWTCARHVYASETCPNPFSLTCSSRKNTELCMVSSCTLIMKILWYSRRGFHAAWDLFTGTGLLFMATQWTWEACSSSRVRPLVAGSTEYFQLHALLPLYLYNHCSYE